MPVTGTVFPGDREWLGVARELVTGTAVLPTATVPAEKIEPDEKVVGVIDKSLRGSMVEEYGYIQGTENSELDLSGFVYMDTIGHFLYNIFGDYQSSGSTPTSATTVPLATAAGATSFTVATIGSIIVGSVLQFGNATIGTAPTENLVVTAVAGSLVTFANTPCRFAHSTAAAVGIVTAPFTHTFSTLNSGNAQPATHTLTHYQGISGSFGANEYASWCASEIELTFDVSGVFTHSTKGTSFLKAPAGSAPTLAPSAITGQPVWRLLVGVGGPASGGTLLSDVASAGVTIQRQIKPYWTANGQQSPYVIGRAGILISGKFNEVAQNENPMLNYLNNVQPAIQLVITNGLSGASLQSFTFNANVAAYDTAKINSGDEIEYDVTWKAIGNTTNAGASGGYSPGNVVLVNAVSTY